MRLHWLRLLLLLVIVRTRWHFAQMSVKLMNKGEHRRADIVGMVMAQVSLKAALKKWGKEAETQKGDEATPLAKLLQTHALEISDSRAT